MTAQQCQNKKPVGIAVEGFVDHQHRTDHHRAGRSRHRQAAELAPDGEDQHRHPRQPDQTQQPQRHLGRQSGFQQSGAKHRKERERIRNRFAMDHYQRQRAPVQFQRLRREVPFGPAHFPLRSIPRHEENQEAEDQQQQGRGQGKNFFTITRHNHTPSVTP
ncbi:hypothetical protein SDC9_150503 [bioreactor metagenome]|uniref:Uncharacterized protein n=1 Tax=bioreactor metagenome TaxID=1076179 RepID=A0A645EPA2_9ZZZZ